MAGTIKQRLRRYNGTDYDSVYLSANVGDVVGTLDVVNGGTGNSSVDTTPTSGSTKMCTSGGIYTALQNAGESTANISGTVSAGNDVTWAGYTWLVMHVAGNYAYLIHKTIIEDITWQFVSYTSYTGSNIFSKCIAFQDSLSKSYLDCIQQFMGSKVWVPSYDMLYSNFTYMTTASNRIAYLDSSTKDWWTCSPNNTSRIWIVRNDGVLTYAPLSETNGFRPAIKVRYK